MRPARPFFQPGIEGVRGLAAAAVLLHHVNAHTAGTVNGITGYVVNYGWLGVQAFFVVSGFLLFLPFAHASLHLLPAPSLVRYFRSRALRILPAYWLAVTVSIPLIWWGQLWPALIVVLSVAAVAAGCCCWERMTKWMRLTAVAVTAPLTAAAIALTIVAPRPVKTGLANYVLAQFYPRVDRWIVIAPSWTLLVEVAFYVLLPLLAAATHLASRRLTTLTRRAAAYLFALAGLIPIGVAYRLVWDSDRQLPVPSYIDQFALGMMLAVVVAHGAWRPRGLVLVAGAAVALVGASTLEHVGPVDPVPTVSFLFPLAMAVVFTLLIASVVLPRHSSPLRSALEWRPIAWLGLISYGVYLWHWPVILFLSRHDLWTGSYALNVLIVAPITLAAASASWYGVERHALRLKRAHPRPSALVRGGTPEAIDTVPSTAPAFVS